jgi:hypothetical protein
MTRDPLIGRVIDGRYRLEALLGTGGLGAVYRATQLRLDRAIAVKVLHEHHAANEQLRARFDREARSLAALSHPNVVPVVDCGVDDDTPYLVMELMEGKSLEDALTLGIDIERALHIAIEVASALAYTHERGIIHRDLKPGNIFLQATPDGREAVRVLDFGLAKFLTSTEGDLTRAGMIMGTPAYIPPEQASGDRITPATDVYSLGVVVFEMVTGTVPFEGETVEVIRQHMTLELPSIATRRSAFHGMRELDALIARACAKEPQARFVDGAAFRAALIDVRSALFPGSTSLSALKTTPAREVARTSKLHDELAQTLPQGLPASPPRTVVAVLGALCALVLGLGAYKLSAGAPPQALPPISRGVVDAGLPADAGVDAPWAIEDAAVVQDAVPEAPSPDMDFTTALDELPTDPWTREPSRVLERFRHRVLTTPLSRAERRHLRVWINTHPEDCRGHLAFGHALMSFGAREEALDHYRQALETELDARADAQLRINLVRIAAWNGSPEEGAALAAEIYGPLVVPDIDAMLLVLDPVDPDARRAAVRLRALRRRVLR